MLSRLTGIDMQDIVADLATASSGNSIMQVVDRFICECCDTSDPDSWTVGQLDSWTVGQLDSWTVANQIFTAFDQWRKSEGLEVVGMKTFFQILQTKFTKQKKSVRYAYLGLQIVG